MWLAEVLGSMRGEEVKLKDDLATLWRCDPHTRVCHVAWFPLSADLNDIP